MMSIRDTWCARVARDLRPRAVRNGTKPRLASKLLACVLVPAAAVLASPGHAASAPSYPTKPVRLVVAAGPGGSTDNLARLLGDRLLPTLGQPLVYDNRPGAGGIIAGDVVARASPDGYTLLFSTSAAIAVAVSLYRNVPYDPVREFTLIVLLATQRHMPISQQGAITSG